MACSTDGISALDSEGRLSFAGALVLAHLSHPIEEISCDDENEKYVGAVIQNGQDGEGPFKKVA